MISGLGSGGCVDPAGFQIKISKESVKNVSFNDKITVYFQDNRPFEAPVNSEDRSTYKEEGFFRRSFQDKNTVWHYTKQMKAVRAKPTFEDLHRFFSVQLHCFLFKIMPNIDVDIRNSAVLFVTESLVDLAMTNPKQSLSEIKRSLKERICSQRVKTESIDKKELYIACKRKNDLDRLIIRSLDLKVLLQEEWQEGDRKNITLTFIEDRDLGFILRGVDIVLKDVGMRAVFMEFITFSASEKISLLEEVRGEGHEMNTNSNVCGLILLVFGACVAFFATLMEGNKN